MEREFWGNVGFEATDQAPPAVSPEEAKCCYTEGRSC
jgi:hypothetical protein